MEKGACGKLLKQINDEMQKNANNDMRALNMTISQLAALLELNSAPEQQLSLKTLEQKLHIAQSTTAGIIARLEQKGFVESFGDANDRRIKLVQITEAGIECVHSAQQDMIRAENRLLSGLTETEQEIFYSLLKKISKTLK